MYIETPDLLWCKLYRLWLPRSCRCDNLHQVGGNSRSTYGTQTRCATWVSIVVRHFTYRANGILYVTKLCIELNYTCAAIGEMWGVLVIRHIVFHYNMIAVFSPASIDASLVSTDSSPISTDSSPPPYNPNAHSSMKCVLFCILILFYIILFEINIFFN